MDVFFFFFLEMCFRSESDSRVLMTLVSDIVDLDDAMVLIVLTH